MQSKRDISYGLILAVRGGRLERVRELISSFGLSYSRDWSDGYVLLCDAVKNNHAEVVKLLLINGAKVNSTNENLSMTPLHIAVKNSAIEIVEMLLDSGANIDAECERGTTPLHDAVRWKKMEIVELLLKRGADVNAKGKYSKTYLHIAVDEGYIPMIEQLLKRQADVNSECTYGGNKHCTPLYIAVINGLEKVVQLLLECGANVDAEDQDGKTILYFAAEKGHTLIVEHLLKNCPDVNNTGNRSALNVALHSRGAEYHTIAENLIQYGFTVNFEYGDNNKLLYGAVEKGYLKIFEELLNYGVSIDSKDKYGRTALHIASERNNQEVVEVLLKFGASINSKDRDGSTALHIASEKKNPNTVKLLLQFGADVDSKDNDDRTALDIACNRWINQELVIALLDHGSDITEIKSKTLNDIYMSYTVGHIFKYHAIKVKTANLYVRNKNVLSICRGENVLATYSSENLNKFRNSCEKEVASMKCEKLGNANISFYDILTKGISQLAIYAGNKSIVQVFESNDYKRKFPIYATLISSNFRKGEKRKKLMEQGNKIFYLFTNSLGIPYDCVEKIFNYLSNDDLRTIMDAYKPICVSSLNSDNK